MSLIFLVSAHAQDWDSKADGYWRSLQSVVALEFGHAGTKVRVQPGDVSRVIFLDDDPAERRKEAVRILREGAAILSEMVIAHRTLEIYQSTLLDLSKILRDETESRTQGLIEEQEIRIEIERQKAVIQQKCREIESLIKPF